MFFATFMIALLVAALVTLMLAPLRSRSDAYSWPAAWALFLIIMLAAWAGGLWLRPFGPAVAGVFWMPILLVGIIAALLLLALTSSFPESDRDRTTAAGGPSTAAVEREEAETAAGVGLFFWAAAVFFIIVIIVSYL